MTLDSLVAKLIAMALDGHGQKQVRLSAKYPGYSVPLEINVKTDFRGIEFVLIE